MPFFQIGIFRCCFCYSRSSIFTGKRGSSTARSTRGIKHNWQSIVQAHKVYKQWVLVRFFFDVSLVIHRLLSLYVWICYPSRNLATVKWLAIFGPIQPVIGWHFLCSSSQQIIVSSTVQQNKIWENVLITK